MINTPVNINWKYLEDVTSRWLCIYARICTCLKCIISRRDELHGSVNCAFNELFAYLAPVVIIPCLPVCVISANRGIIFRSSHHSSIMGTNGPRFVSHKFASVVFPPRNLRLSLSPSLSLILFSSNFLGSFVFTRNSVIFLLSLTPSFSDEDVLQNFSN